MLARGRLLQAVQQPKLVYDIYYAPVREIIYDPVLDVPNSFNINNPQGSFIVTTEDLPGNMPGLIYNLAVRIGVIVNTNTVSGTFYFSLYKNGSSVASNSNYSISSQRTYIFEAYKLLNVVPGDKLDFYVYTSSALGATVKAAFLDIRPTRLRTVAPGTICHLKVIETITRPVLQSITSSGAAYPYIVNGGTINNNPAILPEVALTQSLTYGFYRCTYSDYSENIICGMGYTPDILFKKISFELRE